MSKGHPFARFVVNLRGVSRNRREAVPGDRAYDTDMNPPVVTLVLFVVPLAVASVMALALAFSRAEEGYQDETEFHRGHPLEFVRSAKQRPSLVSARRTTATKSPPLAEPVSVN